MKLSEKITKGEWMIVDTFFGSRKIEANSGDWPENRICATYKDAPEPQCEANAKAIAAVPSMLSLLERLADWFQNNVQSKDHSSHIAQDTINLLNKLNTPT